jgi:hypothetical protein
MLYLASGYNQLSQKDFGRKRIQLLLLLGLRRIPYVSFIIKDPEFKVSLKTGPSNPPSSSDYRLDINFNLIIKLMEVNFQTLVFFQFFHLFNGLKVN